jgi:hypothetical protein
MGANSMNAAQDNQAALLLESGLFTQVEHDYAVESSDRRTFINKSRGVIAVQSTDMGGLTHFAFDKGEERYYSGGWYDFDEIQNYILPLMRDNHGWQRFCDYPDIDMIEAMDYIKRVVTRTQGRREHEDLA